MTRGVRSILSLGCIATAALVTSCSPRPAGDASAHRTRSVEQPRAPCATARAYLGYFPEWPDEEPYGRDWWKPSAAEALKEWSEPPVWGCPTAPAEDALRFFDDRSVEPIRMVRITRSAGGVILAFKWIVHEQVPAQCPDRAHLLPEERLPPGTVCARDKARFVTTTVQGSPTLWTELVDCLDRRGFWTERSQPRRPVVSFDGTTSFMEATVAGRYNALHQTSSDQPPEPAGLGCSDVLASAWSAAEKWGQPRWVDLSCEIDGESSTRCQDLRRLVHGMEGAPAASGSAAAPQR